ncbi:MAG TPA: 3-phosphoshikimate 1-carboxyvinyltransferase [Longimicrobiales bacterium]
MIEPRLEIVVPGDKSITHRSLMLAALAEGESRLSGLLPAEDPRSSASVLRGLGAAIPELPEDGGEIRIHGMGLHGLRAPAAELDCGNSGTTARLMMGILAGFDFEATLTGDASLCSRPMRRVTEPLATMGANFTERGARDRLPITMRGGKLRRIRYESPTASAQVKSAVLLAGLTGGVGAEVHEPRRSRDHTERMLRAMGVEVSTRERADGFTAALGSAERLHPLELRVPGDFSSAAFFLALAALSPAGGLRLPGVGMNPGRVAMLDVVRRMGARVEAQDVEDRAGEPVAALRAGPCRLRGVDVGGAEIPGLVDEVPILAVMAARAEGESRFTGAGELRVKETDRIRAMVENLRAVGAQAEELPDGLVVRGSQRPLRGDVATFGDHRIAMAFGVLGALPGNDIRLDDPACVAVSFPGFWDVLRRASEALAA